MDGIKLEERVTSSPTRRTIVTTGVKLAYAAPILAASFKLNQVSAQQASGNPNPECRGATCATFTPCSSTNGDCVCATTAAGGGFCVPGSTSCGAGSGACGDDGSCPGGEICLVDTCCGSPVCIPVVLNKECPPLDPAARSAATSRESSGPGTIGG